MRITYLLTLSLAESGDTTMIAGALALALFRVISI